MPELDDDALLRYGRHILLDEFGIEGQERLAASHALVIGAGGLGSPALLYLAAAGVGTITLADPDRVDLSNLQRQVAHDTGSVGQLKVESAAARMRAINPLVRVNAVAERVSGSRLDALVRAADVVLDCSDNFATRHAVNRACVAHARPLVSGAAIRFDGQLMVIDTRERDDPARPGRAANPCYACVFPEDAAYEEVACATLGVFAPLVGIIGSLQAAEALKLLAGVGDVATGRLQMFDARGLQWREFGIARRVDCSVCGTRGTAKD
ncbi:HesA/MoeB/ThiF family protein [Rivibacter subsaxonicus]|uniref:Molybdopterin-synthase adenylyltransferase n=1 Tax=Rivibacter subsaxonicus TaxID=457575 RepID=A0A4Q7VGW3_9BURK|nr:molybdopterin-synthase adenylyltransferase MoeB [Rivibacter subsaxonicus]RZT95289.1 molybdopterin/thiamine biosynthesis adenylyltransferase [Rivibacter subsaxonicus]